MRKQHVVAVVLALAFACHANAPAPNAAPPEARGANPVAAEDASARIVAVAPAASGFTRSPLVWRVLRHVYVENDAGYPTAMSVTIQLEVAGKIIGPLTFEGVPGCMRLGARDNVAAGVSCYYAGGGEYIEVREKKRGDYVVVTYGQAEQNMGDPVAPRVGMRTVGTFHVDADELDERMVSADGGAYSY